MGDDERLRRATWRPKACDVCGERAAVELLGRRCYEWPTRRQRFEMVMDDALCGRCGFVFAARVPDQEFLEDFYRDGFSLVSPDVVIAPDYDGERRVERVRRHVRSGARVLEIGAGRGDFVERLTTAGYRASGLDPLEATTSAVQPGFLTGAVPGTSGAYDAIVSYDVLEHVADARAWLSGAAAWLGPEGRMILEVPDFSRAPEYSLNYQHLLHFTPEHLTALLGAAGLLVLELDPTGASRRHSMVAVARLAETPPPVFDVATVRRGRALYERAVAARARERERHAALLAEVARHVEGRPAGTDAQVLFWGANDISAALGELLPPSLRARADIVDNAAQKVGTTHPGFPRPVLAPRFTRDASLFRVFVLCSLAWNRDIRRQIEAMDLGAVILDVETWQSAHDDAGAPSAAGRA